MGFWFVHLLVHHPHIILISVTVFSVTCVIIPFTLKAFPNFSDPQMGFETRGTSLSNRLVAWKNLVEATRPSGPFAVNPKEFLMAKNKSEFLRPRVKKNKKKKVQEFPKVDLFVIEEKNDTEQDYFSKIHRLLNSSNFTNTKIKRKKEGFFCGPPDENYVHFVVKSKKGKDLFTLDSLLLMCQIEHEFMQADLYKDLCISPIKRPNHCCRPWSLGNYIALLQNRTSCLAITEDDVASTKKMLRLCSPYFYNLKLTPDCHENGHCAVPPECTKYNAAFNILNFLTSASYLPPNITTEPVLEESMIFLPLACSSATLPYYHNIEKIKLNFPELSVVAMEFGIKNTLFDECLLSDIWLMGSGSLFILFCIWVYTESLFLTVMTIIGIVFSLGISYFMYMLVFELKFFPFMNLLAIIVAIGIGADDAFIFCKIWNANKKDKEKSFTHIMTDTMFHAFFSMFVTSITTAAAFIASYISSITAIRCFSIFASMAVMANCLLMMSWFPACVVVWERFCSSQYDHVKNCMFAYLQRWCCGPQWRITTRLKWFCKYLDSVWSTKEQYLLESIITFRYVWFGVLTVIALASAFVVFYYPKLQLPNSSEFQLFHSSHPFEQYDLVYKKKFWFKRLEKVNAKLPLRFVFGVKAVDNGDYLDPQSYGSLELNEYFDMGHPKAQKFLLDFCRALRAQPFYQSTRGPLLPNCFIESFESWMQRTCKDPIDNIDRTPCCEAQKFPFKSSVFNYCIIDAIGDLYNTPSEYFIPGMAGPKFSKNDQFPTIKAVVVEYDSNYSYSMSYEYVRSLITQVEIFMMQQMKKAPYMIDGWFVTDLQFYDLQKVLSDGSLAAIGFSMGFALVVLFLSTLNVLTSLYAIFTITCSILVTIAVLVLLGWKLNILESIAVSTAIGLTVDFSLHYTINYRMCPLSLCDNRISATRFALGNMLGPSLMAAVTTGTAGAFMLPSSILPYIQIGVLLVTVMTVSWIYATFHLGSTLAMIGPEGQFGQYYYSKILMNCIDHKPKKCNENNRSTSFNMMEGHELESLTNKGSIKGPSRALHRSCSVNKAHTSNRFNLSDQSPSATSNITIIVAEDN